MRPAGRPSSRPQSACVYQPRQPDPDYQMVVPRRRVAGEPPPEKRRGCSTALIVPALVLVVLVLCVALALSVALPLFAPAHDGRSSILVMGIDRREGTDWAHLTDTIMVLTVDRASHTAGMLSIPRDLQVTIPGFGDDRINTANVFGYLNDYPGGGPALAEQTVELNFDIPIDAYVMIDFQTFERVVDTLDGIEVDVPAVLHDTQYPDPRPGDPYAFITIHFDPGVQHMDGRRALEYARSRMSTSDFDRARRQQQITLAIRQKALTLKAVPRWPALVSTVLAGIRTDLNPIQMLGLARLVVGVDPDSFQQVIIQPPLVVDYQRPDGALVELPNWDLISPVVQDMFGSP